MRLETRKKLADLMECSEQTVTNRVAEGMPRHKDGKNYKYNPSECFEWVFKKKYGLAEDGAPDYNEERARLTKEQADKLERERLREEGETFTRHEVIGVVGGIIKSFSTKIMSIPSKAAPLVTSCKVPEAQNILEGMHYEALQELSEPTELLGKCA